MTTQVGPFELEGPLPDIKNPRLLMSLQPWIDIGSAGTMALGFLEQAWTAAQICKLTRSGAPQSRRGLRGRPAGAAQASGRARLHANRFHVRARAAHPAACRQRRL